MTESNNLDMFLNSDSPPPPEPVVETPPAVETAPVVETPPVVEKGETGAPPAPERQRDDSGRFAKQEDHMVPLSALLSERERRQAAEAKLPKEPLPDIWEDPKAYIKAELDARETELLTKAEVKGRETFLRYTEDAARSRYPDYEQMRTAFAKEAEKNPAVIGDLANAPDPGEYIYRQGKVINELQQVGGDLAAYRQRIEIEIRQKVEKELAERDAKLARIPQSLNTEPSKGAGVVGATWAGPTPLEDILPNRGRDT
jgi:hypothetical protein